MKTIILEISAVRTDRTWQGRRRQEPEMTLISGMGDWGGSVFPEKGNRLQRRKDELSLHVNLGVFMESLGVNVQRIWVGEMNQMGSPATVTVEVIGMGTNEP